MKSYKGTDLEGFPQEAVFAMLNEQSRQDKKRDLGVMLEDRTNGFTWSLSKEGHGFWKDVIENKNFDTFFERYPIEDPRAIGDLEGFPRQVIDLLLREQEMQGNPADVTVFQSNRYADHKIYNGMSWDNTVDGFGFWESVLYFRNFKVLLGSQK